MPDGVIEQHLDHPGLELGRANLEAQLNLATPEVEHHARFLPVACNTKLKLPIKFKRSPGISTSENVRVIKCNSTVVESRLNLITRIYRSAVCFLGPYFHFVHFVHSAHLCRIVVHFDGSS